MAINGLKKGEIEVANDLIALKNKVTAEMARRSHDIKVGNATGGSLTKYSKGSWLYNNTDMPKSGGIPTASQANKVITPINAIKKQTDEVTNGSIMASLSSLETAIDKFSQTDVQSEHNDCSSFCSGLCATTCVGGCRGSCIGGC